jgi:hypothetical protein
MPSAVPEARASSFGLSPRQIQISGISTSLSVSSANPRVTLIMADAYQMLTREGAPEGGAVKPEICVLGLMDLCFP